MNTEHNSELFGEKIKEIRKVHKMTRNEFALALNIPSTTIRGVEQGNHLPSYKFIHAFSSHPMFRKFLLWLLCEPWDEKDHDNENFPLDIKQTKPDLEKEIEIEALQKIIKELQTALENKNSTK